MVTRKSGYSVDAMVSYMESIDSRLDGLTNKVDVVIGRLALTVTKGECERCSYNFRQSLDKYVPKLYFQIAASIVVVLGGLIAIVINAQKIGS